MDEALARLFEPAIVLDDAEVEARVELGAALLDRAHPGWTACIDGKKLWLSNSSSCILGQLCGYYADGLDALELREEERVAGGFSLAATEDPSYTYWKVTEGWWKKLPRASMRAPSWRHRKEGV